MNIDYNNYTTRYANQLTNNIISIYVFAITMRLITVLLRYWYNTPRNLTR